MLVLEKLGKPYSSSEGHEEEELEYVVPILLYQGFAHNVIPISDIRDIVRDLSSTGILHRDLRCSNVVWAFNDAICPRHQRAHRWRLIDFDIGEKSFITPEAPADASCAMNSQLEAIGTAYFWDRHSFLR